LISGFEDPLTVRVQVDRGATIISLGRGKWTEKGVSQKVGTIAFLPYTFTRSAGLIEDKTVNVIWGSVDNFVNSTDRVIEEIVIEGHGQAVDPLLFGGRTQEIRVYESRLQSTIGGYNRNIAISGRPGIGKSSLLRKFEQIARDNDCLAVRREIDPTINNVKDLSNFVLEAFRSEAYRTLSKKTEAWDKTKDFFRHRSISLAGPALGSISVGAPTESAAFVLQETFFKEGMRIWSQLLRSGTKSVVFLFDEADQLQNVDGGWRFLRSVFTRLSEAEGKFMLVVAGNFDFSKSPRSGTSLSEGMNSLSIERYFESVQLKVMQRDEMTDVLAKAINPQDRAISSEASDLIFDMSGGNPYLAQNLVLITVGQNQGSAKISKQMVEGALQEASETLSNIFSDRLEKRSEDEKRVLLALSAFQKLASTRQLTAKLKPPIKTTISSIVRQLVEDGLIRESYDGRLELSSPLFGSFIASELKAKASKSKSRKKKK
jgi:hypothetical protein